MRRIVAFVACLLVLVALSASACAHDVSPPEGGGSPGEVGTEHFSIWGLHYHYYLETTATSNTTSYVCTQSHENRSSQTDLMSFEGSRSVSNSWSCSIGFAADVVSGGVGFSVTWTATESWSVEHSVPPWHIGYLEVRNKWVTKDYDCATYWPLWFNWEYGSGSATDWDGYHTISWDVPL